VAGNDKCSLERATGDCKLNCLKLHGFVCKYFQISTLSYHHINTSTNQHITTSSHSQINTSTNQHITTSSHYQI